MILSRYSTQQSGNACFCLIHRRMQYKLPAKVARGSHRGLILRIRQGCDSSLKLTYTSREVTRPQLLNFNPISSLYDDLPVFESSNAGITGMVSRSFAKTTALASDFRNSSTGNETFL